MKNQKGFTLVELMVVIAIIGIITAIGIPYYNNYRQTACDQAAITDLYNVKAAVQKYLADETLKGIVVATDVAVAVQAVLASTDGRYGYPGPTTKCGVSLTPAPGSAGNSAVLAKASEGTSQGRDIGWKLDMAGGGDPIAAVISSSSSGGTSGGTTTDSGTSGDSTTADTSSGDSGTGSDSASNAGQTTSTSAWTKLAQALGMTEAQLKELVGVPADQQSIDRWGQISKVTGKSVQELMALAGVKE